MGKIETSQAIKMLAMYASLNNQEMATFFTRDLSQFQKSGETETLVKELSIPELVLRLMDNRKFSDQPDEIKRQMIYSDYYSEEAKTSEEIYKDDRRNLCQELHNKLCAEYSIPETLVRFVDLKETEMDYDLFVHYNPVDGIIYMNSAIDYSNCNPTELAERVMHASFTHQTYCELRRNLKDINKVSGKQRYILLSNLMKELSLATLKEEGFPGVRRQMEFNDGFSAGQVYAIFATYEYLNKMFSKYRLIDMPALKEFREDRVSYLESLTGDKDPIEDDEDYEDEEDFDDEDIDELGLFEDEEGLNENSVLYDTAGYDLDTLHTIDTSVLNQQFDGLFYEVLVDALDDCSKEFYEFFGAKVEESFKKWYEYYKETEELSAQENEDE